MSGKPHIFCQAVGLGFHQSGVTASPAEDDFRVHFIGPDTVNKDQVGIICLQFAKISLQEFQCVISMRFPALGDQKHFLAPFSEQITQLLLGLAVAGELRGGVEVGHSPVESLFV